MRSRGPAMRPRVMLAHGRARPLAIALAVTVLAGVGCARIHRFAHRLRHGDDPSVAAAAEGVAGPSGPQAREVVQYMYDGGLINDWQDWGWSPREVKGTGTPARVRFDDWGGWTLAKPGLTGDYGGVIFRVKVPAGMAEFLQVRLEADGSTFPKVNISAAQHTDVGDGWSEVFVPMTQLDPDGTNFERFVISTFRTVDPDWILIDRVGLTKSIGGPRPAASYDPATLTQVPISVDCRAKAVKVSPLIYGIAYYGSFDEKRQAAQWVLGATARRWGGNTTSTYNYQNGAWNTGKDWFFENVGNVSYNDFFKDNAAHGMGSVLTVPIMGWVAKDNTSSSFPVSALGAQQATDQYRPEAGNGLDKAGKPIDTSPSRAYVPITPAFVKGWVEAIRRQDAATGKRSVSMYILDNEPGIWNEMHRDAHPDPLTYDELVQRTIDFGTAVRQADPDAVIAGPAEWGWPAYMYSAKDLKVGTFLRPDRRAHDDMPVIAYYLRALADYERRTGVHILDVLDLHGYPYADKVGSPAADSAVAALRIRSTRSLWDPTYVDESWVKEPVKLLPRMREWIDQNYPGRGMSIGEWNYGGEEHMSGGLAAAEVLGRYAQYGVTSAFYWAYPPENSPAMWAFRAYRNFDGKGGRFLDWFVPSRSAADVSLFASRDDSGTHMVVVALNVSRKDAVAAQFDLSSCGKVNAQQAYSYVGGRDGFVASPPSGPSTSPTQALPPYSITVVDFQLTDPVAVAK
jgi:hypothetical protein